MAFPRLDIVDTDETTVLWSFNDQLGTVNPNSVKAKLGPVDFGIRTEITTAEYLAAGGQVSRYRDPVATATLLFYPAAATADALATGLGVLNKLLERGGAMIWQPISGSPTRLIDFLPSPRVSVYQGQHVPNLASVDDGISLEFLMQPYLRGALVTAGPTNVANDPATANGMILPITVTGDLPTPASIRANMDSGSTVERVHIAHRAQGAEAAAVMTDYVSDTAWSQMESAARGWSHSFNIDTSGTTDANASPGSGTSIARTTYATVATMDQRVHLSRTTKMTSIRGSWDVWVRVKASASSRHVLQLRWGPTASGDAFYFEPEVVHDTSLSGTPPAFGYIPLKLGTIHIPTGTATVAGLQLRFFSARTSGTGNLDWDLLQLIPSEPQATVVVPQTSSLTVLGKDLLTPVSNPAGGTPGVVVGSRMDLGNSTDNVGTYPTGGEVWSAGVHRVTFKLQVKGTDNVTLKVRNVTDSTDTVSLVLTGTGTAYRTYTRTLQMLATGAKAYQAQVDDPTLTDDVRVMSITRDFIPTLASGESLRTEPGTRYSVDRLDSSANIAGYLGIEGEIPASLVPGVNHLIFRADEIALIGYTENENKRTRVPAITVTYSPRYAL